MLSTGATSGENQRQCVVHTQRALRVRRGGGRGGACVRVRMCVCGRALRDRRRHQAQDRRLGTRMVIATATATATVVAVVETVAVETVVVETTGRVR